MGGGIDKSEERDYGAANKVQLRSMSSTRAGCLACESTASDSGDDGWLDAIRHRRGGPRHRASVTGVDDGGPRYVLSESRDGRRRLLRDALSRRRHHTLGLLLGLRRPRRFTPIRLGGRSLLMTPLLLTRLLLRQLRR